ncbi:MAG: electron transport complex subunit RsxC [Candidatus Omnitrophica bacterium]|nr:electron transport complex subunit RsxC [Candidatus Omnitrophota bacterium]
MVKLAEHKSRTEHNAIETARLPDKAYIPLNQHIGKICNKVEVNPGDTVLRGQRLAGSDGNVFAPVHASISGKVAGIQNWFHPLMGKSRAIVIENDGNDTPVPMSLRPQAEINALTPDQIRAIIFEAGIVGMGGASFPTHIKLNPPKPVDTLIINGCECEPYLTGDYRLMVERTKEIILGMKLVAKCLGVKNIYIAVEDNKPEAIKAFEILSGAVPADKQSGADTQYSVRTLKSLYPQGGEKQLIKNVLGKEIPRGRLPFDTGVVVQNVATFFAVYEAVYKMKPLYERVVTVTGSCLSNPQNLLVRIGTPIKQLVEFCGPLKNPPAKIIFGGPMMGIAKSSDLVPVIKSTTGIVLFTKEETGIKEEEFCIRCGACVKECPAGLMPCLINTASEKGFWAHAKANGCLDCIECGICSYVCPANRRIVQSIRRAKMEAMKL